MPNPVVCIDFDGVIQVHGRPVAGALEWLTTIQQAGISPVILTTRAETPRQAFWVKQRLQEFGYDGPPLRITDRKPRAHLYLDDRACLYNGTRFPTVPYIRSFEPWWNR